MKLSAIEPQKTTTGFPYAGGLPVEVDVDDVVDLGKLRAYGDFTIRFMVRLRDGREVFVVGTLQTPEAQKWLRRNAKRFNAPTILSRDEGWGIAWMSVT